MNHSQILTWEKSNYYTTALFHPQWRGIPWASPQPVWRIYDNLLSGTPETANLVEYLRNRHDAKTCDPQPTDTFAKNFAATLSQERSNLRGHKRCLSEAPSPAPKFPRTAVTSTQSPNPRQKLKLCNLKACDLDSFLESYTYRNHTSVFRCNLCRTVWSEHLTNFKECDNLKQSKSGMSARLNAQQHVIRALHHERYITPVLNTEGATLFKCTFCQPETPSCVHPNLRDTFRHISSLDKLRQ
eukprot:gene18164-5749_t